VRQQVRRQQAQQQEPGLVKAQAQVPALQNHHQSLALVKQECLDLKSRMLVQLQREQEPVLKLQLGQEQEQQQVFLL
jgi:hypothetical protein